MNPKKIAIAIAVVIVLIVAVFVVMKDENKTVMAVAKVEPTNYEYFVLYAKEDRFVKVKEVQLWLIKLSL